MHIPIERFVLNIMDEVPLPDLGNTMVAYEENINFYRPVDQYPPYTDVSKILALQFYLILNIPFYRRLEFKICLKRSMSQVSSNFSLNWH